MFYGLLIMMLVYLMPTIVIVLFVFHRKIITLIFNLVRHKETKFIFLSFAKFMINVGASAASIVLVAFFIPQVGVTTAMLFKVAISGIIVSINGYYLERFLK